MGNEESYQSVYEQVEKIVGDFGLDIFFNNAGILYYGNLYEVKSEEIMESFKINAVAPLMLSKVNYI